MTFFEKLEPKMCVVPPGDDVRPGHFLASARALLPFFDMLGSTFTPVKKDINGNITSLQKKYDTNPEKYSSSFRVMLEEEKAENSKKKGPTSISLLWLKRALEYIYAFIANLVEDHNSGAKTENMVPLCKKAYEDTLKRYHGWIVQKVFSVVLHATPWRRDFIKTMAYGQEGLDDEVVKHMETFVIALKSNIDVVGALLIELDLDTPDRV